jgi:hypothetical protein
MTHASETVSARLDRQTIMGGEDMRRSISLGLVALVCSLGCTNNVTTDPTEEVTGLRDGVRYDAAVTEIRTQSPTSTFPKIQFNVRVTLTNTVGADETRTYPGGCAVRVRLYQADGRLAYDESSRDCTNDAPASITIPTRESRQLFSGIRFPMNVLGDSLPVGQYRVVAMVATEGDSPVAVEAGSYRIPLCDAEGCR